MLKKKLDFVILAGGKGRRIKKYLKGSPKPMLKFNKKSFLDYIITKACTYNFENIYILTGYKSNIIFKKYNKKIFNFIKITCLKENKEMGTGGALFKLKKKLNDFILVNGDTIFNLNYNELINALDKNKLGVMSLVKNKYQYSSKLKNLTLKNRLILYNKKSTLMNAGVYFFRKKILSSIQNKKISLENDIMPNYIKKNKINGKVFKKFFIDIGSKKYLKIASKELLKNFEKPAVFLDRDGVINYDYGYVHNIKNFKFRPGVIKGLQYLTKKNYYIFIITNQAGIGKKIFTLNQFNKLHLKLKEYFIKKNILINDVKFSAYHKKAKIKKYKKNSNFRKPGNLMIQEVFKRWDINLSKSFMIGDKKSDYLSAKKSNLKFYYASNNFYKQIKGLT